MFVFFVERRTNLRLFFTPRGGEGVSIHMAEQRLLCQLNYMYIKLVAPALHFAQYNNLSRVCETHVWLNGPWKDQCRLK